MAAMLTASFTHSTYQHFWLSGVEDRAVYLNQRYCSITKCSFWIGNNPTWRRCFLRQLCPESRRKLQRPIYLGSWVCWQLSLANILPFSYSQSLSPRRINLLKPTGHVMHQQV